jgi:hypothetical protein
MHISVANTEVTRPHLADEQAERLANQTGEKHLF